MKYYHYTTVPYLQTILKDGKIKLARSKGKGIKDIAWVSTNPLMEKTALKAAITPTGKLEIITLEEQHEICGVARFEIDPKVLIKWSVLKHKAGYHKFHKKTGKNMSQSLEKATRYGANPNEWYGSLNPITEKHFLNVEIYNGKEWVNFTDDYVIPKGLVSSRALTPEEIKLTLAA